METTEKKLPEDFKAKWVAALRSGEYKQGKYLLHDEGRFCCLGVACRVAGLDINLIGYSKYTNSMPYRSMPSFFRYADPGSPAWGLAKMNDNGKTFSEIADYIEANL